MQTTTPLLGSPTPAAAARTAPSAPAAAASPTEADVTAVSDAEADAEADAEDDADADARAVRRLRALLLLRRPSGGADEADGCPRAKEDWDGKSGGSSIDDGARRRLAACAEVLAALPRLKAVRSLQAPVLSLLELVAREVAAAAAETVSAPRQQAQVQAQAPKRERLWRPLLACSIGDRGGSGGGGLLREGARSESAHDAVAERQPTSSSSPSFDGSFFGSGSIAPDSLAASHSGSNGSRGNGGSPAALGDGVGGSGSGSSPSAGGSSCAESVHHAGDAVAAPVPRLGLDFLGEGGDSVPAAAMASATAAKMASPRGGSAGGCGLCAETGGGAISTLPLGRGSQGRQRLSFQDEFLTMAWSGNGHGSSGDAEVGAGAGAGAGSDACTGGTGGLGSGGGGASMSATWRELLNAMPTMGRG